MITIDMDDEIVYGPDYQSKELKKDFDELGINLRNNKWQTP